jgi:hypothetical protein
MAEIHAAEPSLEDKLQSVLDLLGVIAIQSLRTYDILAALLAEQNPELMQKIVEAHEQGVALGPRPILVPENEDVE